ncbi:hypothetical protein [Smaragdicoccus niigatensis]|uniref:hypothetical protein n=1 Tax=Smaragdicoccus niigatensis TaxID=359359 RepID=UPI00036704F4|nr:hypothetical protein [Smaragdicoccus niigatensis]
MTATLKAVLAAVNVLGLQTRERFDLHDRRFDQVDRRFDQVERRIDDIREGLGARLRSVEEGQAEIKDLLIRALER